MQWIDWILIGVLVVIVALAIRQVIRKKKYGGGCCGTSGSCSGCSSCGSCSSCSSCSACHK